jgi:hypothetical protein
MNAAEMREISKRNGYKKAVRLKKEFVKQVDKEIKSRAEQGYCSIQIPFIETDIWKEYELTEAVRIYYKHLGFNAATERLSMLTNLYITWAEGDGTYAAD